MTENHEDTRQNFSNRQVLEALLLHNGIKKGVWQFGIQFGFGAGNIATSPTGKSITPSAMIGVSGVTIVQVDTQSDDLSVDAAALWKKHVPAAKRAVKKSLSKP